MKNTLMDLNNHLFGALERVNDEELKGDELKAEVDRSKSVIGLGKEIINNARLAVDAEKLRLEYAPGHAKLPGMLESKPDLKAVGNKS